MLMVDETLTDLTVPLGQVITQGLILQGIPAPQAIAQGTLLGQVFGRARQTVATDLICLSAATRIGRLPSVAQDGIESPAPSLLGQLGVTFPLPDRYVLIPSEVTEIEVATNGYNGTIEAAATANNLAFVNAKDIMDRLSTTGISDSGYTLNSTYVSGGAFSLDGIHPSPRGYALIANEFIKAINLRYGSNLKGVKFSDYRIMFPPVL